MKSVRFERQVDASDFYDVVVCGGGPAGVTAAIAAARAGCRTILLEQAGCLGGVATNSLVPVWLGSYSRDASPGGDAPQLGSAGADSRPVIGGIYDEIVEAMVAMGEAIPARDDVAAGSRHVGYAPWHGHITAFEPEACKRALDELVQQAGVEVRLFTRILDGQLAGERLDGVFIHNQDGLGYVRGTCFVDATGNASVAMVGGCQVVKGREEDGLMQAATTVFLVEDVDSQTFERYCKETGDNRFSKQIADYKQRADWPFDFDIIICCELPRRGRFMINTLRQVGVDGTSNSSVSEAMIQGRAQVRELLKIMREIVPGFERARLVQTSERIGIRDTRRIVGMYKLTVDDLLENRSFPDTIALSGYAWDMHDPKRPSDQPMEKVPIPKPYVEVPYRCLVPAEGAENVIVPGRCLSVQWQVLGPLRIMPCCMAMGQAAGLAAAQALSSGCTFRDVDTAQLRQKLLKDQAILS